MTHVVSLDTNNLSVRVSKKVENKSEEGLILDYLFTMLTRYLPFYSSNRF